MKDDFITCSVKDSKIDCEAKTGKVVTLVTGVPWEEELMDFWCPKDVSRKDVEREVSKIDEGILPEQKAMRRLGCKNLNFTSEEKFDLVAKGD